LLSLSDSRTKGNLLALRIGGLDCGTAQEPAREPNAEPTHLSYVTISLEMD